MSGYGVSVRIMLIAFMLASTACSAGDADSPGGVEIRFSDDAVASDVGLPAYPDAKPYKERGDSDSGANIRLATPLFGLKVIASEYETTDSPQAVAGFYRKALAKYGAVLECTDDSVEVHAPANDEELTCEDGDHEDGSYVYKAGTKSNHRIVAVEPHGRGSKFALVHLNVREGN